MVESAAASETKRTWSPARRAAAEARRQKPAGPASSRPDVELIAEDVIGEAVDNMVTLAGFALPIAPYTAVTIAGVPDPDKDGEWLVRSRAAMAGNILLEHAKRNPRILTVIARFNAMLQSVELVEVAGAVIAAAAVDAKLVAPDATVALPGGMEMPLLAPAIGDTIEYIAAQQEAVEPRHVRLTKDEGSTAAGTGDREGAANHEMTPEQRAEARRIRANLERRDEAIANGHPDPGLRREGQTIVPGGVEDT